MRRILIMCFLIAFLAGCKQTDVQKPEIPSKPNRKEPFSTENTETDSTVTMPVYAEAQLLGEADSLEDAQALAELYGITLVEYKNGLGRFHTEEDPRDVILRGKENGWPELVLNRVSSLF